KEPSSASGDCKSRGRQLLRPTVRRVTWLTVFASFTFASPTSSVAAQASVGKKSGLSYNHDIRPILSDNCFFCHGPDRNKRKGKLRLDVREEAIKKEAIVPGKPDESELIRRIFTTNTDDLMPPPESHKTLTPAQKQMFRRWIAQG